MYLINPEDNWTLSILITLSSIGIGVLYLIRRNRDLPPGPRGLPFLGHWPFLRDQNLHLVLEKWQKVYGDLFCFNYAGKLYINMGSSKVIKELVVAKSDCFERCTDFSYLTHIFADGVGFVNGEAWKVLRKFTMHQLKDLGMSTIKGNVSGPIYDSVADAVNYLRSKKGEPVNLLQLLTHKCNVVLRQTMFGEDGITDEEVREINESYSVVFAFMKLTNLLLAGNFARWLIFPFKPDFNVATQHNEKMKKIMLQVVQRHKNTLNVAHPRDFIDAFLAEREERLSRNDPTAQYFTDKALVASLLQFVGDGVLSVAVFVTIFLKYVADHAEIQERIYEELTEVIGHHRSPTYEDKMNLPYTNALINEILRTADFFTLVPSLQCAKETYVRGYRIPKGSITLLNIWNCHRNPDMYKDPESFNPSRFISNDIGEKEETPVTFGIGKRACLGENFTMAQTFLFLTSIIQNFKLGVPKDSVQDMFQAVASGKMDILASPRH